MSNSTGRKKKIVLICIVLAVGFYFLGAKSKEAIKRAVLAGAETIEHGDFIDVEIGKLMKEHNVTYYPTVSAVDVISQYRGWKKGVNPEPANVTNKKKSFKEIKNDKLS